VAGGVSWVASAGGVMGGVATAGRGSALSTGAPALVSVSAAPRLHAASAHVRIRPNERPARDGYALPRVIDQPCDFTAGRPGRIFPSLRPFT
jgi:hypothetical protein